MEEACSRLVEGGRATQIELNEEHILVRSFGASFRCRKTEQIMKNATRGGLTIAVLIAKPLTPPSVVCCLRGPPRGALHPTVGTCFVRVSLRFDSGSLFFFIFVFTPALVQSILTTHSLRSLLFVFVRCLSTREARNQLSLRP